MMLELMIQRLYIQGNRIGTDITSDELPFIWIKPSLRDLIIRLAVEGKPDRFEEKPALAIRSAGSVNDDIAAWYEFGRVHLCSKLSAPTALTFTDCPDSHRS